MILFKKGFGVPAAWVGPELRAATGVLNPEQFTRANAKVYDQ